MKFKTLFTVLLTAVSLTATTSAKEWKIAGADLGGKKGGSVSVEPKLTLIGSKAGENLSIRLTDGKQKFGSATISFKKGDVIYKRPRLKLNIPMDKVEAVTAASPLMVTAFKNGNVSYELHLVHSGGDMPDIVIKQK